MSEIINLKERNLSNILRSKKDNYHKIRSDIALVLEGQKINQKDLRLCFIKLATQTNELVESNKKLNEQLEKVMTELNELKKEREEKLSRKKARANRKRLPKRDPVTPEIYQSLIKETKSNNYNRYTATCLRIALCLLAITGIRVNKLLPLKVYQLKTLLKEGWIKINRSKCGPANYKAYLSKQGKQILKDREKDFDLLYLFKEDSSCIFSSQLDYNKHIRKE